MSLTKAGAVAALRAKSSHHGRERRLSERKVTAASGGHNERKKEKGEGSKIKGTLTERQKGEKVRREGKKKKAQITMNRRQTLFQ